MPLNLDCPNCGQAVMVPAEAANAKVRCATCRSIFAVGDTSQLNASVDDDTTDAEQLDFEKRAIAYGIGIPVLLAILFMIFWFGIRDTWELDHYSAIREQCEAVHAAIARNDDDAAIRAYDELNQFIGDRTIEHEGLAERINAVHEAIVILNRRVEEERNARRQEREASEREERNARRAEAIAEWQAQAERYPQRTMQQERSSATPLRIETSYQGFSEAELARLHQHLQRQGLSHDAALQTLYDTLNYPDTRAVAREWLRNN